MRARVVSRPSERSSRLRERLEQPTALLLDGATGTELERRGIACTPPLWSAQALIAAPDQVLDVHRSYVVAGAELLTANSFRTQRRVLARCGRGDEAAFWTAAAVESARRAADEAPRETWVLGSAAPLEDCYRPDLVPDEGSLLREHGEHAANLRAAGADAILVETMNNVCEARVAATAAAATGLPVLVSFVCGEAARLLSGEPLDTAIRAIEPAAPACVLVNCVPPSYVAACVEVLRAAPAPFGIYANLGAPLPDASRTEYCSPARFAGLARGWMRAGATIVGGCCGTTPEHIAAIAAAIA